MHDKPAGRRVRFAHHCLVRVYERDDEGKTGLNSSHDREEPLPDAGCEAIRPYDIMKEMRHVVRAYYTRFGKGNQSGDRVYVGAGSKQRERSWNETVEARRKIDLNRKEVAHGGQSRQISYRMEFAAGKIPGNSEELALAMKDLAEAQGFAARVVNMHFETCTVDGDALELHHRVAVVAANADRIATLNAPPSPQASAAADLVVLDAYPGACCPYSEYARHAERRAASWGRAGMDMATKSDETLVSPIESGWSRSLGASPAGACFVPFESLPAHALQTLREKSLGNRAIGPDVQRDQQGEPTRRELGRNPSQR